MNVTTLRLGALGAARKFFPRRWWRALLWAAAGLGACGCQTRQGGFEQYLPSEAVAREALESALEARRSGERPRRVDGGARGVEVADTHQQPGQTLAGYEILGAAPADAGRRFAVRLRLENPAAEEKAYFVVIGADPLWVFRQEDYDMIVHWDHPMPEEVTAPATEDASAEESPSPEKAPPGDGEAETVVGRGSPSDASAR